MKFTSGYVLGSLTIIGLGVSFVGGAVTHALIMEKKAEMAKTVTQTTQKVENMTLADVARAWWDTQKEGNQK